MNRVTIGQIIRVRGLRGEMVVLPLTHDLKRYFRLNKVTVAKEAKSGQFKVEGVREFKDKVLLRLKDVDDPEKAHELVGGFLEIEKDELVKLPPGCYFVFDIIGLEVVTTEGRKIGRVKEVMSLPGNDLYVVQGQGKRYDIPAVKEIVMKVDLKKGRMIIRPPEGLLEI
jgi:16S rRNA processing protein RimM